MYPSLQLTVRRRILSFTTGFTTITSLLVVLALPVMAVPIGPAVTGVAPNSGLITGGTTVTLTGTSFIGATAVTFGGTPASSFAVNSATSITVTTPAHSTGVVDVAVTTPAGA